MKTQINIQESENKKIGVAFYRVSTDKQNSERQIEDVRRYCQAMDINLKKEFTETISGASQIKNRKELREMLEYIEKYKPNVVICSELSRLARSQDAVNIIDKWTKEGICFITLKENIKTLNENGEKNPMTDLLLNILTSINIFELETLKYRVKSGLRKTANKGTWCSYFVPFGYDVKEQKLVKNEKESEAVKKIFEWYSNGWGSHKIAHTLNDNNIPTKENKYWRDVKVYKVLANPLYNGKRRWKGELIDYPECKIIDDATFTAVQDRLEGRKNITEINKHYKYNYLLTGKIKCACGKTFVGQGRRNIYMCATKKYKKGCNIKNIKIDWLDEQIKIKLMMNSGKLLFDNSGLINKAKELKDKIKYLENNIKEQQTHQNYLINNITKIGQATFDKKYDDSTELINKYQKEIDDMNIKLSQAKGIIKNPVAVGVIDPSRHDEFLSAPKGKRFDDDIFSKMIIDKELVRKVIDRIDIDNEKINVELINGKTFSFSR